MSHNKLENHYKTMFGLVTKYKFSYSEIENMIVFEKDIMIKLILDGNNTI